MNQKSFTFKKLDLVLTTVNAQQWLSFLMHVIVLQ